jgi:hypothetical protein
VLVEIENGYIIPADEIEAWVESWDTPHELPLTAGGSGQRRIAGQVFPRHCT